MIAVISCGEREDMLDFATSGDGAAGKNIYIFATYPSGAPYDVYLVVADDKEQISESLVGLNIPNAFGNFHISEDGTAFVCFTVTAYINIPPYGLPWIVSSPPVAPTGAFFASNYIIQGAIANAPLYQYQGGWVSAGSFSNSINIMAVDYSSEEKAIYMVDSSGNLQRYNTEDMTFESVYLPVYTPAMAPSIIYLHRGRKHMYVGTTNRIYFCKNPTFDSFEQYTVLGSDMSVLSPVQNASSYCVPSDEGMIFASTTDAANAMHLHVRNGGSWLELLLFPGNPGDSMKLFDLGEGKLALWVDSASALGGVYVFDYTNYELNRISINPLFTIQAMVVK